MRIFIIIIIFSKCTMVFSQRNCGTEDYNQDVLEEYPELMGRYGRTNSDINLAQKLSRLDGIITIPVAVHIVYNKLEENFTDTEIQSQISQLNLDFNGKNEDKKNIPEIFEKLYANCQIQFELKTITRTQTAVNRFYIEFRKNKRGNKVYSPKYEPIKFSSQGGKNGFLCTEYLNIWVGNLTSDDPEQLLGYGSFPGGLCEYDGIVIHYANFGYKNGTAFNKGRTLTHEAGHWLNLKHIWGDRNCGDDLVDDTPMQSRDNQGCPAFPKPSCSNYPNGDMFMNFMDYVNDDCMLMFTKMQMNRMRSQFVEGGDRAYFVTNSTLVQNHQIASEDAKRTDLLTPTITDFKKYYHCKPIHDTCIYAFVFWTKHETISEYKVWAKKVKSSKWVEINTSNNYIKMKGLNSGVLYEVRIASKLSDGTFSNISTPYLFTLKGRNPFNFKKLKLFI